MNDFVIIDEIIPDIILDIRYYSNYNFVGGKIDGYEEPVAILTKEATRALKLVSDELKSSGYKLKIYDSYRPQKAVNHFIRWSKNQDTSMKDFFYPKLNKEDILKNDFVSSKSSHSRGSTVDLSLFDINKNEDVDMGGEFDLFDEISYFNTNLISEKQRKNRNLLKCVMCRYGFENYKKEWWHYTLKNEPYPNTYFDFNIRRNFTLT